MQLLFNLLILIAFITQAGNAAGTAAEPFIAEGEIRILQLQADGTWKIISKFKRVEARDSNGNRYTSQVRPQGDLSTLWLKEEGKTFLVDFASQSYKVVDRTNHPPVSPPLTPDARKVFEAQPSHHLGLPCFQQSNSITRPNGSTEGSEACISTELSVILKSRSQWSRGSEQYVTEIEIQNVRKGAEPDPGLFQIPGVFRLLE
jgi:hypothetical protein